MPDKARNSYNNALKTLYKEAQKYLNKNYAVSARCFGSDPEDPDWDTNVDEAGEFADWMGEESRYEAIKQSHGIFKKYDDKYDTDWSQVEANAPLFDAKETYWIASRRAQSTVNDEQVFFWVRCCKDGTKLSEQLMAHITSPTSMDTASGYYAIRPVFELKSRSENFERKWSF